jgi:energy-coupling factor transport system substrate-specific component
MKNAAKSGLIGKDLVNIGVYTVLIIIVTLIVSLPFAPFLSVMYPFVAGFCALFIAPIFMLLTYKVAKRGTLLVCSTIIALIYAVMGYVYLVPFGLLSGLLCEAVMWKRGVYRSFWHNVVSLSIFSIMLYVAGTFLPIYLFGSEYYLSLQAHNVSSAMIHIQYAMSPLWGAAIIVITVVMAIAGCFIGRRMLRKHFIKAGLISSD